MMAPTAVERKKYQVREVPQRSQADRRHEYVRETHPHLRNITNNFRGLHFRAALGGGCYIDFEPFPFDSGAMHYAFRGWLLRQVDGAPHKTGHVYVVKIPQVNASATDAPQLDRYHWLRTCARSAIARHAKAIEFAHKWYRLNVTKKVAVAKSWEATVVRDIVLDSDNEVHEQLCSALQRLFLPSLLFEGAMVTVEVFISGPFIKYLNNDGTVNISHKANLPSAFAHWTWASSAGQFLVCDIQGVRKPTKYMLTDVCIHSLDQTFDDTFGFSDCGRQGILRFFKRHKCNDLCKDLNLPDPNASSVNVDGNEDIEEPPYVKELREALKGNVETIEPTSVPLIEHSLQPGREHDPGKPVRTSLDGDAESARSDEEINPETPLDSTGGRSRHEQRDTEGDTENVRGLSEDMDIVIQPCPAQFGRRLRRTDTRQSTVLGDVLLLEDAQEISREGRAEQKIEELRELNPTSNQARIVPGEEDLDFSVSGSSKSMAELYKSGQVSEYVQSSIRDFVDSVSSTTVSDMPETGPSESLATLEPSDEPQQAEAALRREHEGHEAEESESRRTINANPPPSPLPSSGGIGIDSPFPEDNTRFALVPSAALGVQTDANFPRSDDADGKLGSQDEQENNPDIEQEPKTASDLEKMTEISLFSPKMAVSDESVLAEIGEAAKKTAETQGADTNALLVDRESLPPRPKRKVSFNDLTEVMNGDASKSDSIYDLDHSFFGAGGGDPKDAELATTEEKAEGLSSADTVPVRTELEDRMMLEPSPAQDKEPLEAEKTESALLSEESDDDNSADQVPSRVMLVNNSAQFSLPFSVAGDSACSGFGALAMALNSFEGSDTHHKDSVRTRIGEALLKADCFVFVPSDGERPKQARTRVANLVLGESNLGDFSLDVELAAFAETFKMAVILHEAVHRDAELWWEPAKSEKIFPVTDPTNQDEVHLFRYEVEGKQRFVALVR